MFKEGTRVKVTFTGKVTKIYGDESALAVCRDNSVATSYFKKEELDKIQVEEIIPEFNPKPGEIYTVEFAGRVAATWFVTMGPREIMMASAGGTFPVNSFKKAYVDDPDCTVEKAELR